MKALLAGMGAVEALAHPRAAEVLASFPKALYVATPAGIAALVAPGVGAGPLHVLLDAAPTPQAAQIGLGGAGVGQCRSLVGSGLRPGLVLGTVLGLGQSVGGGPFSQAAHRKLPALPNLPGRY